MAFPTPRRLRWCRSVVVAALFVIGLVVPVDAQDWPQWRGPLGQGTTSARNLPPAAGSTSLKVLWKTPIPRRRMLVPGGQPGPRIRDDGLRGKPAACVGSGRVLGERGACLLCGGARTVTIPRNRQAADCVHLERAARRVDVGRHCVDRRGAGQAALVLAIPRLVDGHHGGDGRIALGGIAPSAAGDRAGVRLAAADLHRAAPDRAKRGDGRRRPPPADSGVLARPGDLGGHDRVQRRIGADRLAAVVVLRGQSTVAGLARHRRPGAVRPGRRHRLARRVRQNPAAAGRRGARRGRLALLHRAGRRVRQSAQLAQPDHLSRPGDRPAYRPRGEGRGTRGEAGRGRRGPARASHPSPLRAPLVPRPSTARPSFPRRSSRVRPRELLAAPVGRRSCGPVRGWRQPARCFGIRRCSSRRRRNGTPSTAWPRRPPPATASASMPISAAAWRRSTWTAGCCGSTAMRILPASSATAPAPRSCWPTTRSSSIATASSSVTATTSTTTSRARPPAAPRR